jgi:hypothetical protein
LKAVLVLALTVAAMLASSACGGDDGNATSTGPVTMEQRVVTKEDAPEFEADPVEKPQTVNGPDEFISRLGERFINPTPKEVSDFKSSGFVKGRHVTLFMPATPGGAHTRNAPHIFSLTMQFDSDQGANDALAFFKADSVRPCPETCATQAEEFDVGGIPGAYGTHRFATAESIQQTGDTEGRPYDEYQIGFADGVFAYRIVLSGDPGKVMQGQVEEIAKSLYDRVKGAPAP